MRAEIRDYCRTGLYLAFPRDSSPDVALLALPGTSARVEVAGDSEPQVIPLEGRVAHVSSAGVGVFVAAMPQAVLEVLGRTAERLGLTGSLQSEPSGRIHVLQQECTGLFRGFLNKVMEGFSLRGAAKLREAAQDEPSFMQRSRFVYAADDFLQRWEHVQENYYNAMRDLLHGGHAGPIVPATVPVAGELALVGETEFEDWLNLSSVIGQIESDVALELKEFERRYSRLVGLPIDGKNNPFGPEAICLTFQGAIQGLDLTNSMRAVLYKAFGQKVAQQAGDLYKALNQALASMAVAVAPSHQEKSQPSPVPVKEPAETETKSASTPVEGSLKAELAELAENLTKLLRQSQAEVLPTQESAEYSLDHILASLSQAQVGSTPRAAASGPRQGGKGAVPQPGGLPSGATLGTLERLWRTARPLSGGRGETLPPGAGGQEEATLPEASLQELLTALNSMPLGVQAEAAPPLADQIDSQLARVTGGGKRLAPAYRQALDTTASLLRQARADFAPNSDVESLVKRLERTLLKLALKDPDFPAQPGHPARQLVNLIDQFAQATDDKGKFFDGKLQRFLFLLVDRVSSQADEDPEIFTSALTSLDKLLPPIRMARQGRVARLQEASEGRERIVVARARVNEALEQCLAGREVPAVLTRLLDAGWRQHLVLVEMRYGAGSDEWASGMATLDRLSGQLAAEPQVTDQHGEPPQALLNEIEGRLSAVNVDVGQVAAFMTELGGLLEGDGSGTRPVVPMVRVAPRRPAPLPAEAEGGAVPDAMAERVRMGQWWEFFTEDNWVPMQLIWINQPATRCAFANRSATRKLELSLGDLAKQETGGIARQGRDLDIPLLDRSENTLFDETYQQIVRQALHDPVTDLLNRKGFMQQLQLTAMKARRDTVHVVGIIEFDQFRTIANACGVEAAQQLARDMAALVTARLGGEGILATFRDDTLALLLPNCRQDTDCQVVDKLLNQIKDHHFRHGQHSYKIGLNIGVADYPPVHISGVEALRRADAACLAAKALGRNCMQTYEEASAELKSQESLMEWAGRMDALLEGDGLYQRCQMVMPIGAEASLMPYYEVLLGIRDHAGLEIRPAELIPAVERLQRSHELDIWVMQKVFEWIHANPSGFESVGGFAINLSAASLGNSDVMAFLQHVLPRCGVPTEKIIFEITETVAIESYTAAQEFIRQVRRYGCKVSLDDFGSGFTSFAHLKNLRADTLKIDGSYIRDMLQNASDLAMVKSMNDIAHSLGLRTVAEYVESPMILSKLREIGVDYGQGYVIHKPCPIDEILPTSQ